MIGGDHATDSRGIPVAITGERELIQRALLRLSVRKGSFPLDPGLGSELYKLQRPAAGGNLERMAQSYVQEALLPMPEVAVTGVELSRPAPWGLRLAVGLSIAQTDYQLEVDVK